VISTDFSSLGLPSTQLDNLCQLGYREMTPIQQQSIPLLLQGLDVIAQAKTGSGKTAAFAIGMLTKIQPDNFAVQGLVLCPTRELSTQVANEIRKLARYQQNIKVVVLCGGQSIGPQIGSLQHGAHIIVGTPGRIKDHLRKQTLSLSQVNTLVLDEADRMLDMGFIGDIEHIIEQTPAQRQALLFSATYPSTIKSLSASFQRQPVEVRVDATENANAIQQQVYICSKENKLDALQQMLNHYAIESAVLFCNTIKQVELVCEYLQKRGFSAKALHGDLEQRDRDQVLVQFSNRSCCLLVATDVAARGLDIEDLPAVINVDLPSDPDVYVHRIGRTGRAGKEGLALSLFIDSEKYKYKAIADHQQITLNYEAIEVLNSKDRAPTQPPMITLLIGAGRKNKIRPGDILGALTGTAGVSADAVGKIAIYDFIAYVAVERSAASKALQQLATGTIKGKKFKVRKLS
jgi:ATP-independent RNA helicase DbpA